MKKFDNSGMINFKRFTLENGLRVLVHEDKSTPLVAMNILYDVGSRDEDPGMTGLAHLFEHLMFGGSVNIPEYDKPLQMVGGENNAFTNNDITNYYLTIPSENIETGFWLESDRMLGLDFSQKNLDTQKNVVIEEFNQRYLNQPYGDAILKLRPLAYKVHPYRWPTIGMDIISYCRMLILNISKSSSSHIMLQIMQFLPLPEILHLKMPLNFLRNGLVRLKREISNQETSLLNRTE